MSLTSRLIVQAVANIEETIDGGSRSAALARKYLASLDPGTLAGQGDRVFWDTRTLAASATENLDLAGGALLDPFGNVLTFARIKGLVVAAAGVVGPPAVPNVNDVLVGGDVVNTFFGMFGAETDAVRIRPGTTFAMICDEADVTGYVVTPATGDLLKLTNGGAGTSVTFDVIIIGTSA